MGAMGATVFASALSPPMSYQNFSQACVGVTGSLGIDWNRLKVIQMLLSFQGGAEGSGQICQRGCEQRSLEYMKALQGGAVGESPEEGDRGAEA